MADHIEVATLYEFTTISGRVIEARRYINRWPCLNEHDPAQERWEVWLTEHSSSEVKLTVASRAVPARCGHLVTFVVANDRPVGMVNLTIGACVNFTRADPMPVLQSRDLVWPMFMSLAGLMRSAFTSPLVLEHLAAIEAALGGRVEDLVTLQGRSSKKQRVAALARLEALAPGAPRVLLSTGKLVGEGFDHPPLDTLVLAMPISWKGTLQQYAGRLHREHAGKTHVQIVDFVDAGHPALMRMWAKRQIGYRATGYRVEAAAADLFVAAY